MARKKRSKRRRKSSKAGGKRGRGRTAASRAAGQLRHGSREAGRLLGEIGQDIRHEGYHRNPEVIVEEYEGRASNPSANAQAMNPQEIKRMANRLKR